MIEHERTEELSAVIGITALIALAEQFGGVRIYIPRQFKSSHPIVSAIGIEAATALSKAYSPDQLAVPLAIQKRAVHYREQGLSNRKIALRLARTEKCIELIFRKLRASGVSIVKTRKELIASQSQRTVPAEGYAFESEVE